MVHGWQRGEAPTLGWVPRARQDTALACGLVGFNPIGTGTVCEHTG
jgi:hypothetical protein